MKMTFLRQGSGFVPADPEAEAFTRKIAHGSYAMMEGVRARNPEHHKKLFAMLKIVLDNQEHYKTTDQLLAACKLATGHCDLVQTKNGVVGLPKSISFHAMGQDEFEKFYEAAVEWVCSDVIPGLERRGLEREIAESLRKFAA